MTEPDSALSEKPAPACRWPQCGNYVSPGDAFRKEREPRQARQRELAAGQKLGLMTAMATQEAPESREQQFAETE
jgi:hypothetical protein